MQKCSSHSRRWGFPRATTFPRCTDFRARSTSRTAKVERVTNIAYGDSLPGDKGGRNLLDVIRPKVAKPGDKRPVLLQIHGGAWIVGDKSNQGQPLMTHMAAEHGWVCVAVNYRLSPQGTFPDHIVDVKRAFAWIRAHIGEYGGDPDFVCVTGGSAGGHLAALTALIRKRAAFSAGFRTRRHHRGGRGAVLRCVRPAGSRAYPRLGVDDSVPCEADLQIHARGESGAVGCDEPDRARQRIGAAVSRSSKAHTTRSCSSKRRASSSGRLREKSRATVGYLEMVGAQHAFDMFHSPRSAHAVRAAAAFLEQARAVSQRESPTAPLHARDAHAKQA